MSYRGLAIVAFVLAAAASDAAEIRLRSSAGCAATVVRLADVAEILGDDARAAAALAEIPLCPAPAAGGQRTLSQHDVRQMLALSGVEPNMAVVTGSEHVTILGDASTQARSTAKRPLVATGLRQAAFEADAATEAARKPRRSRPVVNLPDVSTPSATESASLPAVDRGAAVTVHARTAGVRITTSGKTLEPGGVGETIGVELIDSKQRVLARVTGPQDVEVVVGGSEAAATSTSR
jgi:hypothetical protein